MTLVLVTAIVMAFLTMYSYYRLGIYLKDKRPEKYEEYCGKFFFWESKVNTGSGFAGVQSKLFAFGWNKENLGDPRVASFKRWIKIFGISFVVAFVGVILVGFIN